MSNLRPPVEYLEKTFEGLNELLNDVYFNKEKPQNHTVRINMADKTAEISVDGGWTPIELPAASGKMIGNCTTYMVQGFNRETHMHNDNVMDFNCALGNIDERKMNPIKTSIHHKLMTRAAASEATHAKR